VLVKSSKQQAFISPAAVAAQLQRSAAETKKAI
jgi:hypothetical protein